MVISHSLCEFTRGSGGPLYDHFISPWFPHRQDAELLRERLGAQRGDEVPGRMFPIDKRQNMTDLNDINLYIYNILIYIYIRLDIIYIYVYVQYI